MSAPPDKPDSSDEFPPLEVLGNRVRYKPGFNLMAFLDDDEDPDDEAPDDEAPDEIIDLTASQGDDKAPDDKEEWEGFSDNPCEKPNLNNGDHLRLGFDLKSFFNKEDEDLGVDLESYLNKEDEDFSLGSAFDINEEDPGEEDPGKEDPGKEDVGHKPNLGPEFGDEEYGDPVVKLPLPSKGSILQDDRSRVPAASIQELQDHLNDFARRHSYALIRTKSSNYINNQPTR